MHKIRTELTILEKRIYVFEKVNLKDALNKYTVNTQGLKVTKA